MAINPGADLDSLSILDNPDNFVVHAYAAFILEFSYVPANNLPQLNSFKSSSTRTFSKQHLFISRMPDFWFHYLLGITHRKSSWCWSIVCSRLLTFTQSASSLYHLLGRWDSRWWKKCKSKSWMVGRFSQRQKSLENVPRDTSEFKSNQNLNSTLYREIPRNLISSILIIWLNCPHHSAFLSPFRVSSFREWAVLQWTLSTSWFFDFLDLLILDFFWYKVLLVARGCMPAHQHCDLFYPSQGSDWVCHKLGNAPVLQSRTGSWVLSG